MIRLAALWWCALVSVAFAQTPAALFVTPPENNIPLNETFLVAVRAHTAGALANAAEALVIFDPSALAVETVSVKESVLSAWPTPPAFSNVTGEVRFSGWADAPFESRDAVLITISFRTLRNTVSNIRLTEGALLLAQEGSNIVGQLRSATVVAAPREVIEVPSSPQEERAEDGARVIDADPPHAPRFSQENMVFQYGEPIAVSGVTLPNSTVYVWLQRGEEAEVRSVLTSEGSGAFAYTTPVAAEPGVYRVWAQVEDSSGRGSPLSETVQVTVQESSRTASVLQAVPESLFFPLYILCGAMLGVLCGYLIFVWKRRRVASHV